MTSCSYALHETVLWMKLCSDELEVKIKSVSHEMDSVGRRAGRLFKNTTLQQMTAQGSIVSTNDADFVSFAT